MMQDQCEAAYNILKKDPNMYFSEIQVPAGDADYYESVLAQRINKFYKNLAS